jgi:hypothetical protein
VAWSFDPPETSRRFEVLLARAAAGGAELVVSRPPAPICPLSLMENRTSIEDSPSMWDSMD